MYKRLTGVLLTVLLVFSSLLYVESAHGILQGDGCVADSDVTVGWEALDFLESQSHGYVAEYFYVHFASDEAIAPSTATPVPFTMNFTGSFPQPLRFRLYILNVYPHMVTNLVANVTLHNDHQGVILSTSMSWNALGHGGLIKQDFTAVGSRGIAAAVVTITGFCPRTNRSFIGSGRFTQNLMWSLGDDLLCLSYFDFEYACDYDFTSECLSEVFPLIPTLTD